MKEKFLLITGRTKEQAVGLHKGKDSKPYLAATTVVEMNPQDMARLNIQEGEHIRLQSPAGQVEVPTRSGPLPIQMLFIPMGPVANTLVGVDTAGTGMPSYKGMPVEVEKL